MERPKSSPPTSSKPAKPTSNECGRGRWRGVGTPSSAQSSKPVARPGDQVEIRRIAFLFTDIRGSSALYNRVGDARAYGWVREHYAVLTSAIRLHDGAVVKTIGDAVMAAFHDPVAALTASLRIRDDIEAFNRNLAEQLESDGMAIIVRLGLHTGPCIAVTLNDRLDYF